MNKLNYYIPGIFLIMSGILILAFPEILIALIASVIIVAGISALYLGHKIKESNDEYIRLNDDGRIDYESRYSHRNPVFRFWGRRF